MVTFLCTEELFQFQSPFKINIFHTHQNIQYNLQHGSKSCCSLKKYDAFLFCTTSYNHNINASLLLYETFSHLYRTPQDREYKTKTKLLLKSYIFILSNIIYYYG
jgi:hypothetical protein